MHVQLECLGRRGLKIIWDRSDGASPSTGCLITLQLIFIGVNTMEILCPYCACHTEFKMNSFYDDGDHCQTCNHCKEYFTVYIKVNIHPETEIERKKSPTPAEVAAEKKVQQQRMRDILSVINRCNERGVPYPDKWMDELTAIYMAWRE